MDCLDRGRRCAIVNYWWSYGHGAALTAFALSKLLTELGFFPCLIRTAWGITDEKCRQGINYQFISRHVACTEENYRTFDEYRKLNQDYDHFLLGSDQVLRLEWIPDEWMFPAISYKKNLIAVSASFGITKINNSRSRIKGCAYYLSRFNSVSVRELDGLSVYRRYFGNRQDLEVIVDPVFLIQRKYYDEIIEESVRKETNFIFFYILDGCDEIDRSAERVSKLYGLPVIRSTDELLIEDFLYYIRNARMIVTDSFHGLCFSVIYNKPFYCIENEVRGTSRILSLRRLFDLDEACFLPVHVLAGCDFALPKPDFKPINSLWERERRKGSLWIRDKLENPQDKRKRNLVLDQIRIWKIKKINQAVGSYIRWKKRRKNRK